MLFPHAKLQGEWAEACFAAEALRRGFIVSKPLGDSAPYDFVLEWRHNQVRENPRESVVRVSRIQVKSVSVRNPPAGIYHVATMRSVATAKKAYAAGDFDFLAAFIIPRRLWYIIPAAEIFGIKMISLCPGHRPSKRRSRALHCHSERNRGPQHVPAALDVLSRKKLDAMGWRSEESAFSGNEKRGTRNSKPLSSERTTFRPRRLEPYRSAWRLLRA